MRACDHCATRYAPRSNNSRYCSTRCARLAYRLRVTVERRLCRPDADFPSCTRCGRLVRRVGATMHGDCHRAERRALASRVAAARRLAKAAAGVAANERWPWAQGTCAGCGSYFVRKGGASPYCSKACNPTGAGYKISRRRRQNIYERDEWTCQLCLEPVDPTLDPINDRAASLDHIICRSRGGDNADQNLRLAHRWCNSVRGDETYYTAAALVA